MLAARLSDTTLERALSYQVQLRSTPKIEMLPDGSQVLLCTHPAAGSKRIWMAWDVLPVRRPLWPSFWKRGIGACRQPPVHCCIMPDKSELPITVPGFIIRLQAGEKQPLVAVTRPGSTTPRSPARQAHLRSEWAMNGLQSPSADRPRPAGEEGTASHRPKFRSSKIACGTGSGNASKDSHTTSHRFGLSCPAQQVMINGPLIALQMLCNNMRPVILISLTGFGHRTFANT